MVTLLAALETLPERERDVQGNNELLSLTRPDVIRDIHEGYLAAGADLMRIARDGGLVRAIARQSRLDCVLRSSG